jgi:hypothetical protein
MVRIIKTILKVTLNNVKLREDTLRCFLLEAMDIVNSRPLTYLPVEPGMEPALTPNMLLKFSTRGDPPPGDFDVSDMSGRKQWRKAQHLADQFWKRWVKEVLPDLTRRTKWYKKTEPLKVDDQVIIVNEQAFRNTWERGVVVKVYPDARGHVRSADVRTANGTYKRPTVKLAVLDLVK